MPIHTFRAATMREALELVRRALGPEAVLLNTRSVRQRRRFPWRKPTEVTEVTVGIGQETIPVGEAARGDQASALTQAMTGQAMTGEPIAGRLAAEGTNRSQPAFAAERMAGIESLLANLGSPRANGRPELPDELFHLYAKLIDAEIDDDHARDLIFEIKRLSRPHVPSDAAQMNDRLAALIEGQIRCSGAIHVPRDRRKVVALVGPTGVGKTTTIAKLAANFRLRDGIRIGLITVDTYRVAAVEQLRTYADILDLPMKLVTSPREMQRAVSEWTGMDLVLIDTAGRSSRDELKIQELKSFLAEADVDEVHLVLSLASSVRSLEATAEKFKAVGATSLLLTKLDEAPGIGAVLSAARRIDLPISYFTTGQNVPDDIEPALASRAARLILGQDRLR